MAGALKPLQLDRQRNSIAIGLVKEVARVDAAAGAASSNFPTGTSRNGGAMTLETHFRSTTTGTGASQLQVFVSRVESTTRVILAGELDAASAVSLSEQLRHMTAELVDDLSIDVGLLIFIDSTGLSLLESLHKKVRALGHTLTIRDPTPPTRRLFQITGLDEVLAIEPEQ
jgi:anti-sigma B factor antagonist